MLPLHIADATAVLRVSGRRICSPSIRRSSSRPHGPQSHFHTRTPQARCLPFWCQSRRCPTPRDSRESSLDILFVNALVRASLCRIHSASYHVSAAPHSQPRRHLSASASSSSSSASSLPPPLRRGYANSAAIDPVPSGSPAAQSKEPSEYVGTVPERFRPTLKSLVGPPDHPSTRPAIAGPSSQSLKTMPLSRIKRIPIEERDKYNMPWLFPASWEETVALRAIRKALRDPDSSNETIFELYRKIPAPRIGYLDRLNMERLITRLMTVPLRDQVSMLRYLTLIEDLKTSNISITRNEWNQASSFVTKSSKYITISELRVAFEQWTESERDYKVPADVATFNILLDSASKSNHQGLAQSILKEMRSRKMKFDRYTFTTLMMYHGSIRDVDNIHRVYKALVDAGEVVDTVVLNTLMTALVMAGEVSSAERIYAFMRRAGAATTKNPTPSMMTWKESRSFGQKLKRNAMQCMLEYVGALNVPLGPDIASFHLFIHYHCRMANWTRAQEVIRDLKTFGLTVDSCVYLSLLKGFAWFGSTDPYCEWNRERLDLVLDVVLDEEKGVFKWDRVTTVWVVRAVAKVYADSVSMEKVWDLIEAQRVRQGGKEPDFAVGVYVSSLRVILEDEDKLRQTMGQEVA